MRTELALILHLHTPMVRWDDPSDLARTWLTTATDELLIPLLQAMQRLRRDDVPFRLALSLSPTFMTMLERASPEPLAQLCSLEATGHLELFTAPATNAVLPLLLTDAARKAQIMAGAEAFARTTGHRPQGLWLPRLAYAIGLDQLLAAEGIAWTVGSPALPTTTHPHVTGPAIGASDNLTVLAADPDLSQAAVNQMDPELLVSRLRERSGLVVLPCEVWLPNQGWSGGADWLESLFRHLANVSDLRPVTPSAWLHGQAPFPPTQIRGDAEHPDLITPAAAFLWPALHTAELTLARVAASPASLPLLERATTELLSAQAADWPALMADPATEPYARDRVARHLKAFRALAAPDPVTMAGGQSSCAADEPAVANEPVRSRASHAFIQRTPPTEGPLRILMLSWEFPPDFVGGLGRHVGDLADALARAGHDVHVVTLADSLFGPGTLAVAGVTVHRVQRPPGVVDDVGWVRTFNRYMVSRAELLALEQGAFDVVHTQGWLTGSAAQALQIRWSVPLTATCHVTSVGLAPDGFQGEHAPKEYGGHLEDWLLAGRANRLIAVSGSLGKEMRGSFGVRPSVICNAVDEPEPAPPPARGFAGPYLFAIGRLVEEKGFDVAVRALSAMRHRAVHLVIAARLTPLADMLIAMAESLGVADRVHLIGWVADREKDAWIQHAAVGLVPSRYESFGIVAIELMAAGVPVVVSDVGGLTEVVTDGVDGRRVPPDQPELLAAAVDQLLDDPLTAGALGKAGRASVRRRFHWDDIARQTVAVYRGQMR